MKEKTVKRNRETELSPLQASATEDEIIVAGILLNLKTLMSFTEDLAKYNWRCKRRRSCLPPIPGAASLPSKPVQRTENKIEEVAVVAEKKDDGAGQPISSPDTPFTFSPSEESDEKSSKKTSKKGSREYYLDMIERQRENRDSLRGEMQNVNKYYENLKSYNSKLKAALQEAQRKVESQKATTENNLHFNTAPYQQQLMAQVFEYSVDPITGSNDGIGSVNRLGFDLNVPAEEEFQPLDVADKRATFAEARRRRRGMMKNKFKSDRNGV